MWLISEYAKMEMENDAGYLERYPEYNLLADVLYDFQQPDHSKMRCKELACVLKKIKDNEETMMEKYEPFDTYYNNKLEQLRQEDEKRISALEAENEELVELVQKLLRGEVVTEYEKKKFQNVLLKKQMNRI